MNLSTSSTTSLPLFSQSPPSTTSLRLCSFFNHHHLHRCEYYLTRWRWGSQHHRPRPFAFTLSSTTIITTVVSTTSHGGDGLGKGSGAHTKILRAGVIESEVLGFLQDRPFAFIGSSGTTINKDKNPSTMTRRF